MVDMPNLDRLNEVRLDFKRPDGPKIIVCVTYSEPDRCDTPNCTEPHRMVDVDAGYVLDMTPENFSKLALHFFAQAYMLNIPTRTDFSDVDMPGLFTAMISENIAGLPPATRQRIRAIGTDLGNLILAASDDLDTAMTGDSIAGDLSWLPQDHTD